MTARLVTSNSPFEYVNGTDGVTWSIDPAGVATIDQRGRVTPVASGNAIVTASYGDKTGTNSIRVLPDYVGHLVGRLRRHVVHRRPRFSRVLAHHEPDRWRRCADVYPFTLTLSQDRDQVTGTLRETARVRRHRRSRHGARARQRNARARGFGSATESRRRFASSTGRAQRTPPRRRCLERLRRSSRAGPASAIPTLFEPNRNSPTSRARVDGRAVLDRSAQSSQSVRRSSPNECDFRPKFVARTLMFRQSGSQVVR